MYMKMRDLTGIKNYYITGVQMVDTKHTSLLYVIDGESFGILKSMINSMSCELDETISVEFARILSKFVEIDDSDAPYEE